MLSESFGNLRVVARYDDEDVRSLDAETVVDEWIFSRSLLVREDADVIRGAMRLGALEHRRTLGRETDYAACSVEQVERAMALEGAHERPTDRQRRAASKRLRRQPIRDLLAEVLTAPDVGLEVFVGWGRLLEEWGLDAGPLSTNGRSRQGDANPREGERDGDVARRLWAELGTPAKRRYRDRDRKIPTQPRHMDVWAIRPEDEARADRLARDLLDR